MDRNSLGVAVLLAPGVALRKESVDRNFEAVQIAILDTKSLSARRAWIEIVQEYYRVQDVLGRSPQGERG